MGTDGLSWITHDIAIARRSTALQLETRSSNAFRSVICLDGSLDDAMAAWLGYDDWFCCELVDGPGNDLPKFARVVDTLSLMVAGTPPVLVYCHAGRSRSVAVVAANLARVRSMATQAALDLIAGKRETAVQPALASLATRVVAARALIADRGPL